MVSPSVNFGFIIESASQDYWKDELSLEQCLTYFIIASILPSALIVGVPSRSHSQQEIKTIPSSPQSTQIGTKWTGEELSALTLKTTVAKMWIPNINY